MLELLACIAVVSVPAFNTPATVGRWTLRITFFSLKWAVIGLVTAFAIIKLFSLYVESNEQAYNDKWDKFHDRKRKEAVDRHLRQVNWGKPINERVHHVGHLHGAHH